MQRLILLVAFVLLGGCQSSPPAPVPIAPVSPVGVGNFIEDWRAVLPLGTNEPITRLYLRGDMVFAYTGQNAVYAMSATGGQVLWLHHIGQPGDMLQPPLVLEKDLSVIPSISTIDQIEANGQMKTTIEIGHSIRSPIAGAGVFVYGGLDYASGGRIAKIDLTKSLNNTIWEIMTNAGISAAPAFYQNIIFAGGENGLVYAVNESRDTVWPLEDGVFKTDGRILADLKAESTGVYIASTDTKLYCLDVASGKIKWQYFASEPLVASPMLTADSVYQALPSGGVVALDKTTGDFHRKPRWIVPFAARFLAEDSDYVYLQNGDNSIVGVDKKTGEPKLHSQRTDLVAFASNPKSGIIYAATSGGMVLAIKPVTKAGTVGQTVKAELEFEKVASAR